MNKAFGKEGVSSIEWVGMGKFVFSEARAKHLMRKKMEKITNGNLIMKVDGFNERLSKVIGMEEENVKLMKTKIKNENTLEYIRRLEEQLATQKLPKGRDIEDIGRENEDM